jgi:hypothetical protein
LMMGSYKSYSQITYSALLRSQFLVECKDKKN